MKIIGYTVGTTLPKPSLAQTDPSKGDYIKDKDVLDGRYIKLETQDLTEEQKLNVRANIDVVSKEYTDNAVSQKSQVQIITWGADD